MLPLGENSDWESGVGNILLLNINVGYTIEYDLWKAIKLYTYLYFLAWNWASKVAQMVKNLPAMWKTWAQSVDWGSSQSSRSPGAGHGNPLQYSCLENPMDR